MTTERIRVYIAGPISKGDLAANIRQADEAFFKLLRAGFAPFCPHWSAYSGGPYKNPTPHALPAGTTHQDWIGADLPWVEVADAVLRLPGESVGADMEVDTATRLGIPIYREVEEIVSFPPKRAGDPRYMELLAMMARLHQKKAADYGDDGDPLANIRASAEVGIMPWLGAWLRAKDKVKRIDRYCRAGRLENEGVEDSFMDLAAYALIGLLLHREYKASKAKVVK